MRRLCGWVVWACLVGACGDDTGSGAGSSGGEAAGANGSGANGSGANGSGANGSGANGSGANGSGGAPPCTADTLEEATRVTTLTIEPAASGRAITAERPSGSIVAWAAADGTVRVTPLDAVDQRAGNDLSISGSAVFGAAASAGEIALLIARPPDFMTFKRIDDSGQELSSVDLVGGGDHNTEGVEWFGEFASTGRLVRASDGSFAAYHALHRRWPDGIGHQGDTLRLFTSSGQAAGGGWGWGCSHSMDQRLAAGPTGLVPICIADCYPGKGIYFNHNASMITDDPAANCAGGYTTELGGLVADASGFFLVYQDDSGAAHLGRFDLGGQPISDRALSAEGQSRLARFGDGLLLGATGPSGSSLQRLDAAGADVGAAADIAAPLPDQDFEGRADGEVAWASASGTTLTVVRVRQCE